MANVVALIKDERVRHQVEVLLDELGEEDLRYATFKSQQEFQELYFRETQSTSNNEPNVTDLKLFSEVNLLIFALDAIEGKPGNWIDHFRSNLKKFRHMPGTGNVRIVMLKYEDDGIGKLDVLHRWLDDLVYLPLDRLVFLQKLQILLTLPKRAAPRFLFNQEVRQQIEISKIVKVDRFSDVGLAIRNPVPLKKGLPGHFYIQFPGEKDRLEVFGKVMRSEPHPEFPGQYLVYFSYFCLSRNGLSQIRRVLLKAPGYKSFVSENRELVTYRPDDLTLFEEKDHYSFGVVIIETDEAAGQALGSSLQKEMDRLSIGVESSFQVFLHRYFNEGGTTASGQPPRNTEASEFYANPITLTISPSNMRLVGAHPLPADDAVFLGHPAVDLFSSPEKWLTLIEETSRLLLEEAAQLAMRGLPADKLLIIQDAQKNYCALNMKVRATPDRQVQIELSPASLSEIFQKTHSTELSKNIDAMIVDSNFIPDEPSGWMDGLRTRAKRMGYLKDGKDLKIWVTSAKDTVPTSWLNRSEIIGLLPKPVDNRQLLYMLSCELQNKNTLFTEANLGWSQPGFNLHISKEIELEAVSEFGATLKSNLRLVPGTMVYLRKGIYDQAPNGCLAARVYFCEEHPSEKTQFQVLVTYFGINDAFLRFARTWIRDNYAQQKIQGNG